MCFRRSGISPRNKLDIFELYNVSGCNDSVTRINALRISLGARSLQRPGSSPTWAKRRRALQAHESIMPSSVRFGSHAAEEMALVICPTLGWRTSVVLPPTPRAVKLEKLLTEP